MQFRIRQDLRKCGGMFEKFKGNGRMKMFLVKKRTLLQIAGIVWLIAGFNVARLGVLSYLLIEMKWVLILLSVIVFAVF